MNGLPNLICSVCGKPIGLINLTSITRYVPNAQYENISRISTSKSKFNFDIDIPFYCSQECADKDMQN